MKRQLRQTCKVLVDGMECGATYRYPADFEEHQRIAHKPVQNTANRSTWSDKDGDDTVDHVEPTPEQEAKPPVAKRSKKK